MLSEITEKMTRKVQLVGLYWEQDHTPYGISTNSPRYLLKKAEKVLKLLTKFQISLLASL